MADDEVLEHVADGGVVAEARPKGNRQPRRHPPGNPHQVRPVLLGKLVAPNQKVGHVGRRQLAPAERVVPAEQPLHLRAEEDQEKGALLAQRRAGGEKHIVAAVAHLFCQAHVVLHPLGKVNQDAQVLVEDLRAVSAAVAVVVKKPEQGGAVGPGPKARRELGVNRHRVHHLVAEGEQPEARPESRPRVGKLLRVADGVVEKVAVDPEQLSRAVADHRKPLHQKVGPDTVGKRRRLCRRIRPEIKNTTRHGKKV